MIFFKNKNMRQKIVAGNWKMNTNLQEGKNLSVDIVKLVRNNKVKVIIIPPFTHLSNILNETNNSFVSVGAQNCAVYEKGAYTGEVSAEMLKSIGIEYVLIGHSERRAYFNETNETLKQKLEIALKNQLLPIFCCGETLEERNSNNHFSIVKQQLKESLFHLENDNFTKLIIAYEPVWAIGTGLTASSQQAEEMHAYIREVIQNQYGDDIANNISILYGGSCKPTNAKELFSNPNVDGGLIGGAALNANDFIGIINSF